MPSSNRKVTGRQAFSLLTEKWNSSSMKTYRSHWNAYASRVIIENLHGKKIRLSGFNHFVRINVYRARAGLNLLLLAPTV